MTRKSAVARAVTGPAPGSAAQQRGQQRGSKMLNVVHRVYAVIRSFWDKAWPHRAVGIVVQKSSERPHVRHYHVRYEVPANVVDAIGALDGVELTGSNDRYNLYVYKGQAFNWDEVEPAILAVFEEAEECGGGS